MTVHHIVGQSVPRKEGWDNSHPERRATSTTWFARLALWRDGAQQHLLPRKDQQDFI